MTERIRSGGIDVPTVINIALGACALTASLAAFGGKTTRDGEHPLFQRITQRGWVALICFVSTFGLIVAKEIVTNAELTKTKDEKLEAERKNHVLEADKEKRLADQLAQLQRGLDRLDIASTDATNAGVILPPGVPIRSTAELQQATLTAAVSIALSAEEQYTTKQYAKALDRFMAADRLAAIAPIKARIADTHFHLGNYEISADFERAAIALAPDLHACAQSPKVRQDNRSHNACRSLVQPGI
jgi:hypothetical protein